MAIQPSYAQFQGFFIYLVVWVLLFGLNVWLFFQAVVIDEVDSFLFRPHLGLRAKYHAVCPFIYSSFQTNFFFHFSTLIRFMITIAFHFLAHLFKLIHGYRHLKYYILVSFDLNGKLFY